MKLRRDGGSEEERNVWGSGGSGGMTGKRTSSERTYSTAAADLEGGGDTG